jgi:hypothetical protein
MADYDILLKLIVDQQEAKKSEKTADDVAKSLTDIDKEIIKIEADAKRFGVSLSKTFQDLKKEGYSAETAFKRLHTEYEQGKKASASYLIEQKKIKAQADANKQALSALTRQIGDLNRQSSISSRVSGSLNNIGNLALGTGTAGALGLFAEARRHAAEVGTLTAATERFNKQLDRIGNARGRIDQVIVTQLEPILDKAGDVAEKVANVVEKNPQLVDLAIKGSALLIGVGALTKLAASGFKVYADVTYFAAQSLGVKAATMQLVASENQLIAAGIGSKGKGIGGLLGGAGGTGALAGAGSIAVTALAVAATVLAGVGIGTLIYDQIAKRTGGTRANQIATGGAFLAGEQFGNVAQLFGMSPEEAERKTIVFAGLIGKLTGALDENSPLWVKAAALARQAGGDLKAATADLTDAQLSAAKAFEQYKNTELETERQYQKDRLAIIDDSNDQAKQSYLDLQKSISDINKRAKDQAGKITSSYNEDVSRAAQENTKARANIIKDGNDQLEQLERDRLESLRKLELEHTDREADLIANRDALGLVLEQRNYEKEQAEINRQAGEESKQARQETQQRLAEQAQSYAEQRKQRYEQYKQDIKDNEERRKEEIKKQQEQYAEELRQIEENKRKRLQELALQYREEQKRNREAFIARIRDLDASLLGEQVKRREYYQKMLVDLQKWLQDSRNVINGSSASLGTGSGTVGRAGGGYVNNQLVQTHGVEYVTNPGTTRALEQLIGGKITQQRLLQAVSRGTQNVVNDQSHKYFTGEYSQAMRQEIRRDTSRKISRASEDLG